MHWSDYLETEGPVFSENGDRYGFYGLYELAIEIIEQGDYELNPKQLPSRFFECDRTLLGTDVPNIALRLFEGSCPVTIVEGLIEDLYDMTELDYPNYFDLAGFKKFESKLLRFTSLNYFLWLICGKLQIFNPAIHSIGLDELRAATLKFSEENKYVGTWYPDYKKPIELDETFWQTEVFPHVQ